MTVLDYSIVAAYLAITLGVGLVFARRAGKSTEEFFISGRNLPWWLAGTSMVATSFAADTPLFITSLVRDHGISHNWMWWSFAIGGVASTFLLARLWRRAEVTTDVELSEVRYGGRSAAALRALRAFYLAVPIQCIALGLVIVAMRTLLEVLVGLNPTYSIAACLALTLVYAVLSGFWGVVVTDLFQFVMAMTGAVALAVLTVMHFGSLARLRAEAEAASALGGRLTTFWPEFSSVSSSGIWWKGPVFAFGIFVFVQWWAYKNADGGGVIIQRMSASRSERDSLLATLWFNVAHYALRPWPWIIVALGSVVLFPDADGERAYPLMIKALAPAGLMGVMVASFLGAFMSTVDTLLNLSSAYLVSDLYRRFLVTSRSERHYVLVSRIASVFVMVAASAVAFRSNSIVGLFTFLLAFTSGFGLVLILRWFWWRVNAWSEISAMVASGTISSLLYMAKLLLWKEQLAWMSSQHVLLFTVVASTLVWLPVTFLTAPVEKEKLSAFYRKVRPPGAWGPVAALNTDVERAGLGLMLADWIAGTVMVLAATFSIGAFVLTDTDVGLLCLGLAAGGAGWIYRRHFARGARRA